MERISKTNLVKMSIADLVNSYLVTSDIQYDGSRNSELNFLSRVKFGKKLTSVNFLPMIDKVLWQSGSIYTAVNPYKKESGDYICVQVGSNIQVFFCVLSPNAASSTAPFYNPTMPSTIVECIDGYKWKYVYNITADQLNKFSIGNLIPILPDQSVVDETSSGIIAIHVKNGGLGYEKKTCVITSSTQVLGRLRIYLSGQVNTISNFYLGQSAVIKGSSITYIKDILSSGVDSGAFFVEIEQGSYGQINGLVLEIVPKLEIFGDGSNFLAYADIINGSVSKIIILNQGSGYTDRVWARIKRPLYGFDLNNGAVDSILETLKDPGFGDDYLSDFGVTKFAVNYTITASDPQAIGTSFNSAAVVKQLSIMGNPSQFDNRIQIKIDPDRASQLEVGQSVSQSSGFSSIVDKVEGQYVYLSRFTTLIEDSIQGNFTVGEIDLFSPLLPILIGNTLINIIEHTLPIYDQMSGVILYYKNFDEITHTDNTEEQFRFLVEF